MEVCYADKLWIGRDDPDALVRDMTRPGGGFVRRDTAASDPTAVSIVPDDAGAAPVVLLFIHNRNRGVDSTEQALRDHGLTPADR